MTMRDQTVSLVISDVDGTLLDDNKQLTPGAPSAVERLRNAGIRFSLASARPPQLVRQLVQQLSVCEPVACFNGALVIGSSGSVLKKFPMKKSDASLVASRIREDGFDLWVWTDSAWFVTNPNGPHVAHHEGLMGHRAQVFDGQDLESLEVLKLVGVSDDHAALEQAEAEMHSLGVQSISATRSSPYYLDVTDAHANKGAVVTTLSNLLGIPASSIATIGDMITDTLMFAKSGVSIAMGNAFDDVKAKATYVTRSNEEDGFAYAMDHFILGDSPA